MGPMWIVRLALRRPYTIAVLCTLIAIFGGVSSFVEVESYIDALTMVAAIMGAKAKFGHAGGGHQNAASSRSAAVTFSGLGMK